MSNPFTPGSDQWYEYEAAQNAAKGQGIAPPAVATPPPTFDQYRAGGGGAGQGPAAPAATPEAGGGLSWHDAAAALGPVGAVYAAGRRLLASPSSPQPQIVGAEGSSNAPSPVQPDQQASAVAPPPPAQKLVSLAGQGGSQQSPQGLPMPGVIPGGGGPARVIPGGRTPQSWQVTAETGQQYSPELLSNIDKANQDAQRALELEQSAQKDAAAAQSVADEKRAVFDAQERQKREEADRARLEQEKALKARVDAARDINPSAAWDNKSGFQKAMTMFAAFLAGAAAGIRGEGGNPVLDRLHAEAERDTQLQLKRLDDASGELKDFYAQYPTHQAKLAAGTALRLEDFQRQNESLFVGAKNQLAAAQGLKMASALQEKQNELRAKIEKDMQGKEVVARHDVMTAPKVVGGGGGPRLDPTATLVALRKMGGEEAVEKFKKDVDAAASMYKGDPRAHDRALIAMSAAWGVQPGQLSKEESAQAVSYGERMEKSSAPRLADMASRFRQMAEQVPGQEDRIPGFRYVDAITPDVFMGDQAYANQTFVDNSRMMLGQIVSGSSVSKTQEASVNRTLGGRGTKKDFLVAAELLEQEARARDRAASAGISPRAVETARKNYGDLTNKVLNTRAPGEK